MKRNAFLMPALVCLTGVIWAAALLSVPARADEPQVIAWKIASAKTSGTMLPGMTPPAGDDQVQIDLFANAEEVMGQYLLAVFPGCGQDPEVAGQPVYNLGEIVQDKFAPAVYNREWKAPGPRWRICAARRAVLIPPKGRSRLEVDVDFLRLISENENPRLYGKAFVVTKEFLGQTEDPEKLADLLSSRQPGGNLIIDLYYRLNAEKRIWTSGPYARIFGAGVKSPELSGGPTGKPTLDYNKDNMGQIPVVVSDFRRTMRLPDNLEFDQGQRLFETLEMILSSQPTGQAGEWVCDQDDQFARSESDKQQATKTGYHFYGLFSTKWSSDHSLHPGWGFRVEAWTTTGGWHRLASDWVQSDGTWNLYVPSGFTGTNLQILYLSYNDYYSPRDRNENTYTWGDPMQAAVSTEFNAGHRFANTDGGTYNGVGELVDAAMWMWSRLYWRGGINPVPPPEKGPIKIYFPNTWYDCGDGSGSPWSCANPSGKIWLIAAHGVQAEVVTHEMGHQLNYRYWNYKRPANAGGSHNSGSCYPTKKGMTLLEGFANFIPAWIGYPDRNVADNGFGTGRWSCLEVESRVAPPNCADGTSNELWVARTFWDLHDTRSDGNDILWYSHPGAVIALYLANGVANDGDSRDMHWYEDNVYEPNCSSGHATFIQDIFDQNRQQ